MNKGTFEKEIMICRKLHKKSKGCKWGECADCGVIPLLYKLHKGEIIEDKKSIRELKNNLLK